MKILLPTGKMRLTHFPTVELLAVKYMPILASSAPVESLFIAGKGYSPDSCRFTGPYFIRLMNIRSNNSNNNISA